MATAGERVEALRTEPEAVTPVQKRRLRGAFKTALGVIAWAFLILWTVVGTAFLFFALTATGMLGSAPAGENIPILLAPIVTAGAICWLVARYVTSRRAVARIISLTVAVLLLAGTVWARSFPDESLFLARAVAWGDSDVLDFQKFDERAVANVAPVFNFGQRPSRGLFDTITYPVGGRLVEADFEDFLTATNTTSFIVIKDDAILYEGYANGYERDSIVTSFSIAKSVTSALVGIAIDEGFIRSVNDPMVDYLPEMRGRGFDDITIRDLLLMSTGIRFIPQDAKPALLEVWPFHDEALSYYHPNMRDLALHLPPSEEPTGVAFRYNQYHPLLLGMILERSTGRPVTQYLQDKIWQPLGMEFPASWSLDSQKYGFEKMESGINGRAIDFAKFGRLFLNNGHWNEQQLISEQWVVESTAPDPDDHRPWLSAQEWKAAGGYYKYMWWGMALEDGSYYYSASGHLGQRIAVFPDDDLIIVRFGRNEEGLDISWDALIYSLAAELR
jgi:CubicO group peptidase (beta-lactamase class C family)